MDDKCRILAFGGGGIRGIASAIWLQRLVDVGALDLDKVFLFCGTSSGGILAGVLASGRITHPMELVEFYRELAPEIFDNPNCFTRGCGRLCRGGPHNIDELQDFIADRIGKDTKVGHIDDVPPSGTTRRAKRFCIPIWNLAGHYKGEHAATVEMVNNFSTGHYKDMMSHWPLYRVLAGSSAAPTYFAPVSWTDDKHVFHKWTDGGQVDQSSLLSALVTLLDEHGARVSIRDVEVLSIGTGYRYYFEGRRRCGCRIIRRIRALIAGITQTNDLLGRTVFSRLFGNKFHRCDFRLDKDIELDDSSKIRHVEKWARKQNLDETIHWLRNHGWNR